MSRINYFTRANPCPICKGGKDMPQHQGVRCAGFLSADGKVARCSRAEHAGSLAPDTKTSPETYPHWLAGKCLCDVDHGGAVDVSALAPVAPDAKQDRRPIVPVPGDAPPPSFKYKGKPPATAWWAYRDAAGAVICYRVRFPVPGGGKDVLPYTFCEIGKGKRKWCFKDLPSKQRPLYGQERLAARPDAPVLMVEGESAADAAHKLVPSHVAMTWPGGAGNAHHADWSPVAGRDLVFWPDADLPSKKHPAGVGIEATWQGARLALAAGARSVRIVELPCGPMGGEALPDGWDLADFEKPGKTPHWLELDRVLEVVATAPLWEPAQVSPMGDSDEPPPNDHAPPEIPPVSGGEAEVVPDVAHLLDAIGEGVAPRDMAQLLAPVWRALASLDAVTIDGWKATICDQRRLVSRNTFNTEVKAVQLARKQARLLAMREQQMGAAQAQAAATTDTFGVVVSERYTIGQHGVYLLPDDPDSDSDGIMVAPRPIWLSRTGVDPRTGSRWVKVAFLDEIGNKREVWVTADIWASHHALRELAKIGAPISTGRINSVGDWLCEAAQCVPPADRGVLVATTPGWHNLPDGESVFLVPGDERVEFIGDYTGPRGTVDGWAQGLRVLLGNGEAGYALLAAAGLAAIAPMVRKVEKRNPILGIAAKSGTGKGTGLAWVLAMWGEPDRFTVQAIESTNKGLQDKATKETQDMPLFVDELQQRLSLRDPAALANLAYFFGTGKSRTVAKRDGSGAKGGESRKGVTFYAAEHPVAEHLPGGAGLRVIELTGHPLASEEQSDFLARLASSHQGAPAAHLAATIEREAEDLLEAVQLGAAHFRKAYPALQGDDHRVVALVTAGLDLLVQVTGVDLPCAAVGDWLASWVNAQRLSVEDASSKAFRALVRHVLAADWVDHSGSETVPSTVARVGGVALAWCEQSGWNGPGEGWLEVNPTHREVQQVLAPYGPPDAHLAIWAERGWSFKQGDNLRWKSREAQKHAGISRAWRFPYEAWVGTKRETRNELGTGESQEVSVA